MKLASFRIVLPLLRAPPKQFCAFPVEITRRLFADLGNRSRPAGFPWRFRDSYALLPILRRSLRLNGREKRLVYFLLMFKWTNAGVRCVQNFRE